MASPESNRIGGARPSGAGVKGLLAMFEKSSSSPSGSTAPGNGSNTANSSTRDQSPGPRPLGKVRTSFVAVTGNGGSMLGLQKAPVPTSPMSPAASIAEDGKLAGEVFGKEKGMTENESKKEDFTETSNERHVLDESNLKKHDLESQNGNGILPKALVTPTNTRSSPDLGNVSTMREETILEKPLDQIPTEMDEGEHTKPVKAEPKSKPADTKVGSAPKSPTKSTFSSKTNKLAPVTKSGKTLVLPPSKSTTTSPLPSPAFAPKSPVCGATTTPSSGSRTKPSTAAPTANPSLAKSRAATSAPTTNTSTTITSTISTVPKPRSLAATTEKIKVPPTKKAETKPTREPSKPPTIRSSAFAPTAASAAKLAADQKAAAARSRPPSSASVRNRSPPSSTGMRRGNSGMSSRPGRKDQRSPQRPQTSAAIRNPNRTSVGSLAGISGTTGGDFLSRMTRPTTASAGKVSDKKPGAMNPSSKHSSSKRSASVASTSRRREKSLPPSTGRLQKQKTGEKAKGENTSGEVMERPEETFAETTEVEVHAQEAVDPGHETTDAETITEAEVETQELEDGNQSPTTTTSSTTLVHEGEGKDGAEILAKE